MNKKNETIIIKKYSNRRLYNTKTSNYITHEDVFEMVVKDQDFKVLEISSNKDITNEILVQIICEQEQKGYSLLPENFLRQIIKCYNNKLGGDLPKFLVDSMAFFTKETSSSGNFQESIDKNYTPMKIFGEITKKNIEIFGKSMSMFTNATSGNSKNE